MFTVIVIPMTSYCGIVTLGAAGKELVAQISTVPSLLDLPLEQDDRVLFHSDRYMVIMRKEKILLPGVRARDVRPDALDFALPREDDRVNVAHSINTLTERSYSSLPRAGTTVSTIQFTVNAAGRVLLVKNQQGVIYTNKLITAHGGQPLAVGQSVIWNSTTHRVVMSPVDYSADLNVMLVDIEALRDEHFSGITSDMDLYCELFPAIRRRIAYANKKSLNRMCTPLTMGLIHHNEVPVVNLMLTYFNRRVHVVIPAVGEDRFGRNANKALAEGLAFGINVHDDLRVIYQFVNPSIDMDGIPLDVGTEDFVQWKPLTQAFDAVCAEIGGIDKIKDLAEKSFNTAADCWILKD